MNNNLADIPSIDQIKEKLTLNWSKNKVFDITFPELRKAILLINSIKSAVEKIIVGIENGECFINVFFQPLTLDKSLDKIYEEISFELQNILECKGYKVIRIMPNQYMFICLCVSINV